jgi:DNA invertase Pin-like site-specific DNA recombinase
LVAEVSRLGRNMFEVIDIVNQLGENGVEVIFVRQPELSTAGPHRKLLLAIYSYFAEAEREFISVRTKQGLAAAKASGKKLGRPKGSRDK